MTPRLSVVLPVYNRVSLLPHPLESLRAAARAAPDLAWELVVVDDGSTEDVAAMVGTFRDLPVKLLRLPRNSGLLAARLAGLAAAKGDAVFFLDGDDAVAPEKFLDQLSALGPADVVYGDVARRSIDHRGQPNGPLRTDTPLPPCSAPAEFYLSLQPAPHNPIFRRRYLLDAVEGAWFPPSRDYDAIAETWFYYQLSARPGNINRAPGVWSIVGEPEGERITRHWERLAAASLRLMRAFLHSCPAAPATLEARRRVGLCAFATWRAFPHGFPPADAFLEVWRLAPPSPLAALGGTTFARVARLCGATLAGRLFRRCQRPSYESIRTVDADELARLFPS